MVEGSPVSVPKHFKKENFERVLDNKIEINQDDCIQMAKSADY